MKFLATAAWVVLIGITVSACVSFTFDDDNKPPYGQSSGKKSGRP